MSAAPSVTTLEDEVAHLDAKLAVLRPAQTSARDYALKYLCAAMSTMCASGVTNPFDVIKVRQQLRTQLPGQSANAFWAVGAQMVRAEGPRALTHGFAASMMREFTYSGMRLGTYEFFKDTLNSASNGALTREGVALKVLAATCSSSIGSFIANPTDVVKVRMQAHYPQGRPYHHTAHAFASVFREGAATGVPFGGVRALWRGAEATTARGVILSISQIASYDQVKQSLKAHGVMREGLPLHITASLFAGLCCSVMSSPVDVVKVRLMTDKNRELKGVFHGVRTILVNEGPMAFYKGFSMCWARLGTHTIVSFLIFEELRKLVGIAPV
ncbi:mitochondrial carrier [Phanerochaete sordida]|uniref:Mitochondrial carrier n=1 Tax=Phanerochaete sordida TaxID=48140 RepID=A0A9P3GK95_9APHY|nr:mitochondrial carrier [Phanerochaete sordida]